MARDRSAYRAQTTPLSSTPENMASSCGGHKCLGNHIRADCFRSRAPGHHIDCCACRHECQTRGAGLSVPDAPICSAMWPSLLLLMLRHDHVIRRKRCAAQHRLHVGEGVARNIGHKIDDTARGARRDNDLIQPEQRIGGVRRLRREHVKPCASSLPLPSASYNAASCPMPSRAALMMIARSHQGLCRIRRILRRRCPTGNNGTSKCTQRHSGQSFHFKKQ